MNESLLKVLFIGIAAFPLALAILVNLIIKNNFLTRRYVLIGSLVVGFVLGAVNAYPSSRVSSPSSFWSYVRFLFDVYAIYGGLRIAWQLFAITYIWIDNAGHFWGTTLLAGLATALVGSYGLFAVSEIAGIFNELLGIGWSIPFFTVGALTHMLLRAHVPVDQPGYYRLSVGRVLLALVIITLSTMLSVCASVII